MKIELLGNKTLEELEATTWFSDFQKTWQQPWTRRALRWIAQDATRTKQWLALEYPIANRVFTIIAAGLFEKNKAIEIDGEIAVRMRGVETNVISYHKDA